MSISFFIICFALFSWVPHWNLLSCRLIITISCVVCYKSEEFWHCTSRFLAALAQLVGRKKGKRSELKSKRWRPVKFLMEYVTDSPFDALLFQFSHKLHSYLRFISPFSVRTFTHSELSPGISSYAPTDHNHNELRMRLNWYRSNN